MRRWVEWIVYNPQFFQLFDLMLHIFGVPHNH